MTQLLSDEEAFGLGSAPTTASDKTKLTPGIKLLSDEEALGLDSIDAVVARSKTPIGKLESAGEAVKDSLVNVGKAGIAATDMLFGAPAAVAGWIAGVERAAIDASAGKSKDEVYNELINEELPPIKIPGTDLTIPTEVTKAPFQTIAKIAAGMEPYNMQALDAIIDKAATTGARVLGIDKRLVQKAISGVMAFGGTAALRGTVNAAMKPKVKSGIGERATYREEPTLKGEPQVPPGPEAVEITTPKQVKAIFKRALEEGTPDARGVQAVKDLFEAAKRQAPPKIEPVLGEPEVGAQAGRVPKTRIAEPVILGEEPPPPRAPTLVDSAGRPVSAALSSGMFKIEQGRGFEMTATEKVAVRKAAQVSEAIQNGPSRFQRGSANWKDLAATFVAVGGAYGLGIWAHRKYNEWVASQRAEARDEKQKALQKYFESEEWQKAHPDVVNPKNPALQLDNRPEKYRRNPLTMAEVGDLVLGGLAMAGAVRVKGSGVWPKDVVAKLAEPLGDAAARGVGHNVVGLPGEIPLDTMARAQKPIVDWSQRAITNHLNKYFGTAEDPLAGVKIPMLGDEVTWGDIADKVVKSAAIPKRLEMMKKGEAQIGESVWDVEADAGNAPVPTPRGVHLNALISYLSHVGDYLREFVPPEKLQNYDLARAVRETGVQDAKQAAKMAKARASEEGTTPYKTYPDGMKWVEVGTPAKEVPSGYVIKESGGQWHAKSPDGKGEYFQTKPEAETWAKQQQANIALKNEGDVMGHCVGGYCEAVHNGESKIYSLRDAKGMSHVTVEVVPEGSYERSPYRNIPEGDPRSQPSILQIKGKQNRAPVAQYLPYVQDFVKSGKWGDVGDLENAGLIDLQNLYQHKTTFSEFVRGKLGDQKYIDLDALHELKNDFGPGEYKGPRGQRGSADPKLLAGIAAVGGGAVLGPLFDPDHPLRGAIYGALAGLALGTGAGRAALKAVIRSPDVALGALSTRLGNIAPELKFALRQHELRVLKGIDAANDAVLPFLNAMKTLPKDQLAAVSRALLNGNSDAVQSVPALARTYAPVRAMLADLETRLQGLGRFGEGVVNYFPRLVRDFEGLKKALGQEAREGLERTLMEAEAKMIRKEHRSLTDVEQSIVANRYLFARDRTSFQPGYAKGRRLEEVPEALVQFYEPPAESLLRYISGAVNDLEVARFFGRDLAVSKRGKKLYNDVDSSIGNLTARLMSEGKLTQEQSIELRNMLKARFEGGEQGMNPTLANVRNLANAGLLGNVSSAATQIGDSLMTVYHQGLVPVLQATAERLIGKQRITPKQLGLINHVAEELSELGVSGRVLHNVMKYSGFHAVDMFAKGLLMNAALVRGSALAKTTSGQAKLRAKYQAAFGDEMPALIEDLRVRRVSDNVEAYVFNELSDAQPISKAEMPEAYLRNPNGRILYQMKTYMIKQADIVRRDAYQNIASGNPKRMLVGAKNLAALASVYALSNVPGDVVKDWLSGRDTDPFTTPKLVENVLQTFGVNRYSQKRLGQGKIVETAAEMMTPPVKVLQDVVQGDPKAVAYVPILGRAAYDRWLGGNERREIYERSLAPKGEKKPLSPAAKRYLRERAQEKKAQERKR